MSAHGTFAVCWPAVVRFTSDESIALYSKCKACRASSPCRPPAASQCHADNMIPLQSSMRRARHNSHQTSHRRIALLGELELLTEISFKIFSTTVGKLSFAGKLKHVFVFPQANPFGMLYPRGCTPTYSNAQGFSATYIFSGVTSAYRPMLYPHPPAHMGVGSTRSAIGAPTLINRESQRCLPIVSLSSTLTLGAVCCACAKAREPRAHWVSVVSRGPPPKSRRYCPRTRSRAHARSRNTTAPFR